MSAHAPLEIEIKFVLDDPPALRRRLRALGATAGARVFETNACYDTPGEDLRHRGMLLRLRRDAHATLTVKTPSPVADTEVKIRGEIETRVADAAAADAILRALGYHPVQVYEKWRATFGLDDCAVCLDELPFGTFVELEGPRDALCPLARRLDLAWPRGIRRSYLALFEELRRRLGLNVEAPTFAAFAGVRLDKAACRRLFERPGP